MNFTLAEKALSSSGVKLFAAVVDITDVIGSVFSAVFQPPLRIPQAGSSSPAVTSAAAVFVYRSIVIPCPGTTIAFGFVRRAYVLSERRPKAGVGNL
jgi:hypothetical protein